MKNYNDMLANKDRMIALLKGEKMEGELNPKIFKTEQVHISQIKAGDLIIDMSGENSSVCKNNIDYDPFFGTSIKGQTWWGGHLKVTRYVTTPWGCLIPIIINKV